MAEPKIFGCPVEFALDRLGGKWKAVILARLKDAPMRYGELRRIIPDLSDKVLTQRLRDLGSSGLVEQRGEQGRSRYQLTERGETLRPVLEALYAWGEATGAEQGVGFRPSPDQQLASTTRDLDEGETG